MRTLIFETHGWRGFGAGRDLFCRYVTCAYVTAAVSRESLRGRIARLKAALEMLR